MDQFVSHKHLINSVTIPPSKSFAQRAILAATLCATPVLLKNLGKSKDVDHFLQMSKKLGAKHKIIDSNTVEVNAKQQKITPDLNAGESGLGLRLITMVCAVIGPSFTIDGTGSLLKRPILEFESILQQMGVSCVTNNGFLPIKIDGKAKANRLVIDGSSGSQYLTGLLMALPLLEGDSTIEVNNLTSRPYIDITISVLAAFGIIITHTNYEIFTIKGNQKYVRNEPYIIEGDYSGAANWMVYGAIQNQLKIKGLNSESVQGDKKMLLALTKAGVQFEWIGQELHIRPTEVQAFTFDANSCPDLFPALVVLAAASTSKSTLIGANRLIYKESNRAKVLIEEFGKLGLAISQAGDQLIIQGKGSLNSGEIHAHNDHRIAMAGAIAAGLTPNGILIREAESVSKSYPSFWEAYIGN